MLNCGVFFGVAGHFSSASFGLFGGSNEIV